MLDVLGHNVWVLIPIVAIIAGVFKHNVSVKEQELDRARGREVESAQRHALETNRLEERVRVLERIVTDKGMDLSDEIERLRDKPAVRDMRAD